MLMWKNLQNKYMSIFTKTQPKYSILNLGYDRTVVKTAVNLSESKVEATTPELSNIFTSGVAAKSLLAGELLEFVNTGQAGLSGIGILDSEIRIWVGSSFEDRASAPFRVNQAGDITASSILITGGSVPASLLTGIIAQSNLDVANAGWSQTCAFSVTDLNTVAWGAGSFITASGTTYSISASDTDTRLTAAGLTSPMNARLYIYLNTASSTTQYQCTYTAATAVGAGKVLLATAINGAVEAVFEVFGGVGGLNINASSIVSLSITANEIAASTITSGKISVSQLSAIAADMGSLTAGTVTGALIRTASSGTRVELNSSSNALLIYNSAGTNIGKFGSAGANGNFMNISQTDTNEDYPPVYITSAQDSNVINAFNTNAALTNRPGFRFESSNASSELMYLKQTGDNNGLVVENTSSTGYGTLYITQNGTSDLIDTNVAGCFLSKAGVWTDASSRTLKENFESISVLDKLKTLDILKYNYIVDAPRSEDKIRENLIISKKKEKYSQTDRSRKGGHNDVGYLDEILTKDDLKEVGQKVIGELSKENVRVVSKHFTPMAEDFNRIFALGDDKGMSPNDVAGIALQAIKELLVKVELLEAKINAII